jgi:hypothetical protein
MRSIVFLQQINHVFEGFHMPALVAGHGNALSIFFYRGVDQLLDRSVVGQMDNFDTGILQNPAHDICRGIVTVEKCGGGDYSDNIFRSVNFNIRMHGFSFCLARVLDDFVSCNVLETEADAGNLEQSKGKKLIFSFFPESS